MDFNSKMGYSEQDYQLLKETTSGITGKVNDVAAKLPEVDFGPGSFTIEKNVPFYGFVAGNFYNISPENILGGNTNITTEYVSIQNPIGIRDYPELAPIVWDGTKGTIVLQSLGACVEFTLEDDTKPGIFTIDSKVIYVYTIKTNLKG